VLAATCGASLDKSLGRNEAGCDQRTDISFHWKWRPLFHRYVKLAARRLCSCLQHRPYTIYLYTARMK